MVYLPLHYCQTSRKTAAGAFFLAKCFRLPFTNKGPAGVGGGRRGGASEGSVGPKGRQRTERAEPRRPPPTPAGPFLVNGTRKHFARKKAPAAKASGGGAPQGRFWGFIPSILSLCFVKKWGDWQISAKVTFSRAKLPKTPKFPILLARSNRMSESYVVLKFQLDRTKIADFLLPPTFGPLSPFFSKPPIFGCLALLSFVHS